LINFYKSVLVLLENTGRRIKETSSETDRQTKTHRQTDRVCLVYRDTVGCSWSCCEMWTCCWDKRDTWVDVHRVDTFLAHSPHTSPRWHWKTSRPDN